MTAAARESPWHVARVWPARTILVIVWQLLAARYHDLALTGSNKPLILYSAGAYRVWAVAMSRRRPRVGDVIQVTLPTGRYAYGRVLRDSSVAFYSGTTSEPGLPPIGSRDYQFVVGVYDDVPGSQRAPVVGHDPSQGPEDDWPPPNSVRDPISGAMRIYHHGHMRPAAPEEAEGLEPAAAWDLHHLIDRLMGLRHWSM